MKAFIVYSDYINENDTTIVRLFGKLENGQSFVTLNSLTPYFYIRKEDKKAALKLLDNSQITETKLTTLIKLSFYCRRF